MSLQSLLGIACLMVFVLGGRIMMGLFPPKRAADWWKILVLSMMIIASMAPLIFLDFQSTNQTS